jgi:hypothetical protein
VTAAVTRIDDELSFSHGDLIVLSGSNRIDGVTDLPEQRPVPGAIVRDRRGECRFVAQITPPDGTFSFPGLSGRG